jgi:hypothetical protein
MTAYLVCEGDRDAQLLKRVSPEEILNNVEIIPAGGLSAVKSLARSLRDFQRKNHVRVKV